MKCKILHYVPGFDHGGIESRLLDWYKKINQNEFHFDLLKTTSNKGGKLIKEFENLGGEVYTLPKFSPKNYKIFIAELEELFKKNNYDVVHCHSPTTGYFILQIAKKYNVPLRIMHARTTQFDQGSRFLLYRHYLKRKTVGKANRHFACSTQAGKWMYGQKNEFEIINNGIEVDKFKFNPQIRQKIRRKLDVENSIVLGYVSRLTESKNHLLLIDIIEELNNQGKNAKLLLIGDGPEKERILEKMKKTQLENKVILLGNIDNVNDYYQAMDYFIFPSKYEGFGTVAIEAQASGLKTIVSSGVPEAVDVTNLVERISLRSDKLYWVHKILEHHAYDRTDTSKAIKKAGYDVMYTVEKLEKIYRESLL